MEVNEGDCVCVCVCDARRRARLSGQPLLTSERRSEFGMKGKLDLFTHLPRAYYVSESKASKKLNSEDKRCKNKHWQ